MQQTSDKNKYKKEESNKYWHQWLLKWINSLRNEFTSWIQMEITPIAFNNQTKKLYPKEQIMSNLWWNQFSPKSSNSNFYWKCCACFISVQGFFHEKQLSTVTFNMNNNMGSLFDWWGRQAWYGQISNHDITFHSILCSREK